MIKTLRQRLTLSHTLVALLAVIVMALLSGQLALQSYREFNRQRAQFVEQGLQVLLSQYVLHNRGWDGIGEALEQRLGQGQLTHIGRVVVSDAHGLVLYDSFHVIEGELLPARLRDQVRPIRGVGQPAGFVTVSVDDEDQTTEERAFFCDDSAAGAGRQCGCGQCSAGCRSAAGTPPDAALAFPDPSSAAARCK